MSKPYDVDEHILVPKHEKLSEKDKQGVLEEFNITITELPSIMVQDSAIRGLNVKVGDVIKILRKSQTSGETVFYRVVTDV